MPEVCFKVCSNDFPHWQGPGGENENSLNMVSSAGRNWALYIYMIILMTNRNLFNASLCTTSASFQVVKLLLNAKFIPNHKS